MLRQGDLGHAYLFVGQDASEKMSCVEEICALLTGKNFDNNPNVKFIRPNTEKNDYKIYIENIRDLKSFMFFKPYSGEYKIAVIDDADAMTVEAANAILKILEEPPKKSPFFLVSSKPKLLPRTILSRCETVVFPPKPEIQTEEMSEALAELRKVARQNIAERIKYAKQLHEKGDYAKLVNLWLRSLRLQLVDKPASAPILRRLLHLSHIVSQPQYNHRIALENFFVHL